ncbi:hypothetical protein GYMLUDRAFT_48303 [Collybiopsis luxurians FD-317 M1]|uniref:Long chronological lifespan protein 2 n=1 Tax=Collybiopsis luxurians FD-317 M1 TaxID=944289 RepID=A0A0D0CA77_9AGAR|nr:hypothetical protein GYMLUDRAFT_48303 [Collybiopsis luxurians FD-317 M1]
MYGFKAFIVVTLALALSITVSAEPIPQDPVYHCGGDEHLSCPPEYNACCGPIIDGVGGTCTILAPGDLCIL